MGARKAGGAGTEGEISSDAASAPEPGLWELAKLFCRVGSLTFGGGSPTTVALQFELVERRAWLDQNAFAVCYAFSRLTPGTNLLAFCTAAGWSIRRWPGALVALLAASLPCSAIAVLFTFLYGSFGQNPIVAIAIRGMLASAVGILLASSWELVRPYVGTTGWLRTAALFAGSVILSVRFRMSPIPVLFFSALVGLTWQGGKEHS